MQQPDKWITVSSRDQHTLASVAMLIVGSSLAIGFRDFADSNLTENLAGFLLGILLLVIGFANLLFSGTETIIVDTRRRRIAIETKHRFGTRSKVIRFDEIADAYVGEFGDREGGSISYHVVVKLKSGKEVCLFFAFFEGQHNKSVAQVRCQRLLQCMQTNVI